MINENKICEIDDVIQFQLKPGCDIYEGLIYAVHTRPWISYYVNGRLDGKPFDFVVYPEDIINVNFRRIDGLERRLEVEL